MFEKYFPCCLSTRAGSRRFFLTNLRTFTREGREFLCPFLWWTTHHTSVPNVGGLILDTNLMWIMVDLIFFHSKILWSTLMFCSNQLLPLWRWRKFTMMLEKDPPCSIWTLNSLWCKLSSPKCPKSCMEGLLVLSIARLMLESTAAAKPKLLADVNNVTLISWAGSSQHHPGTRTQLV